MQRPDETQLVRFSGSLLSHGRLDCSRVLFESLSLLICSSVCLRSKVGSLWQDFSVDEVFVQMFSSDYRGLYHKKHEIHYYPFQHCTLPSTMTPSVTVSPPSVVSAACVDVYGTHSNVHLGRFHTGKTVAAPSPPETCRHRQLPSSPSSAAPSPPCIRVRVMTVCPSSFPSQYLRLTWTINLLYLLDFFYSSF